MKESAQLSFLSSEDRLARRQSGNAAHVAGILFVIIAVTGLPCYAEEYAPSWRDRPVCGANCCYVILRLVGVDCRYADVIRELGKPPEIGYSAAQLKRTLEEFGLNVAIVKCDYAVLCKSENLPAIIHTERFLQRSNQMGGHYSVLVSCDSEKLSMIDGTTARLEEFSKQEFLEGWSGYVILPPARSGSWLTSPVLSLLLGGIALWLVSISYNARARRGSVALALILAILFPTGEANAQDVGQILREVEDSRGIIKSLDVQVEITDIKPQSSTRTEQPISREERFAFKGENRFFEKKNHTGEEGFAKVYVSVLGSKFFQQMTDTLAKQLGKRDDCPEATFSATAYGDAIGWEFYDPTLHNEDERALASFRSLESVLRNPSYRIVKTDGNLITLEGVADASELEEKLDPGGEGGSPAMTDTVVLDSSKAFVLVSRRISVRPGTFVDYENSMFEEVAPGAWLPKSGGYEAIDGQQILAMKWKVTELHVNSIDDELFEKELVPRSTYVDLTEEPDPNTGFFTVHHVPGARADFDVSIASARNRHFFLWGNILLIGVLSIWGARRYFRRRNGQKNGSDATT